MCQRKSKNIQQLKIATYNPRSINNKTIEVLEFIKDIDVDIVLIQESWLKENDTAKLAEIKELGYQTLSNPRNRRGGGVAVLHKQYLKIKSNRKAPKFKSFECMEVMFKTADELIRLTNIYRPQYSKKHPFNESDFLNEFEEYLCSANTKPGETIIMGDFNLHFQKVENQYAILLNNLLEEYSYVQIVPPYPTQISGNTLDLILVSNDFKNRVEDVHIENLTTFSDHYLISCILTSNLTVKEDKYKILEYRKFSSLNIDLFRQDIRKTNLFNLQSNTFSSINDATLYYTQTLKDILDKHCPVIEKKIFNKHEAWFDEELRECRRRRRKVERTLRKERSLSGKANYNKICKSTANLIKQKRKAYNHSKIENCKGDNKKLYSKINSLLGKDDKILPDTHDDKTLAENFKTFFTEKIEDIRSNIEQEQIQMRDTVSNTQEVTCELSNLSVILKEYLHKLIKDLPNKNSELDVIPNWLLKKCFDDLCPILLFIINKSIVDGEFPQSLKHALVTPVLKSNKDDTENLKTYRPISNLPAVSKLLERAISDQLNEYLNTNNLYCDVQSGYRKGHSCETLLLKFNDDIINEISKNNFVAVLLLDLSAAFDAIDHNLLLKKLESLYGIKGNALKWFKSYLADRTFSVKIRKTKSSIQIIFYGVPQGSILGPILFILYTKELSDIVNKHKMQLQLYADDSTVYLKLNPANTTEINLVISTIQNCISEIKKWMTANYMKLNDDKTQLIIFGKPFNLKKYPTDYNILINDNEIKSLNLNDPGTKDEEGKSLGVMLENDTKMKRQISTVRKSSFNAMHNLRNIKEYLTVDTKLTLIKSLILSKLDFCNSLYTNIPQYQITTLQRLLNYCIRFIYNLPKRTSVSDYYLKSHILPIHLRIQFKSLLIVHKCFHACAPSYIKSLLQTNGPYNTQRYNLRSINDVFSLQTKHTARTSSLEWRRFSLYAPVMWNKLPFEIRQCDDTETFKRLLKTLFFKEYEKELQLNRL